MNAVKWGVLLTTAKPDHQTDKEVMDNTVDAAEWAENAGFHSAWLLEHHFTPYGLCPDTLSLAGYILGRTNLDVGSAVVIAPLLHPLRIAESTALLDQLSSGRFHLGLGRGSFPTDFQVFDVDPTTSHEQLWEGIDVMIEAWTNEKVVGNGPAYQFPSVPVYPRPHSRPHPPLYVAGESPSTVERAASAGIPLLIQQGLDDEEIRQRMELYNEFAEAAGHDPERIEHVLCCIGHIADSREQAHEEVFQLVEWWSRELDEAGFQVEDLRQLPNYRYHLRQVEQMVLDGVTSPADWITDWLHNNPVGTPEQCVERLSQMLDASGATHVALGLEGSGNPEMTRRNIERFATEVFPHVTPP